MRKYCFAFLFFIAALCMQGIAYGQLAAPPGRPKFSLAGQLPPDICRELGGAVPQVGRYQAETLAVDTPTIQLNLLEVSIHYRKHQQWEATDNCIVTSDEIDLDGSCAVSTDLFQRPVFGAINRTIYFFRPTSAGVYQFLLNSGYGRCKLGVPTLELFVDTVFAFPPNSDNIPISTYSDTIRNRFAQICTNIAVGSDMLDISQANTFPGPVVGGCLQNGITFDPEKLYYIQVTAPHCHELRGVFEVNSCNCSRTNPNSQVSFVAIPDPNPNRDLPNRQKKIAHQLNLPKRLKEYEWYSLPVQEAKRPRYKIVADFDCAIAFHTYRDAEKLRSYNPLVAKRLRDGKTKRFKLGRIPRRRELRMVVAHKSGETGSIKIQPRNKGAREPTIIQVQ
jgi:hypothetical protein